MKNREEIEKDLNDVYEELKIKRSKRFSVAVGYLKYKAAILENILEDEPKKIEKLSSQAHPSEWCTKAANKINELIEVVNNLGEQKEI